MKAVHLNRLAKLATHLEKGKLAHKKFDFSTWNGDKDGNQLHTNGCGFVGCAVGECPEVFPRHWKWLDGYPVGKSASRRGFLDSNVRVWRHGQHFFGLLEAEFAALFTASHQEEIGLPTLYYDATRKQVAKNIRAFIAIKKQKGAGHSANP